MAQTLIEKLNAIQNLSPDEIVKRLAPRQFICCATMTQAQYDYLREKRTAFYNAMTNRWERDWDRPSFEPRISSYVSWRTYEGFMAGYWEGWWIIAQDDYYEGIKCPTSSSA